MYLSILKEKFHPSLLQGPTITALGVIILTQFANIVHSPKLNKAVDELKANRARIQEESRIRKIHAQEIKLRSRQRLIDYISKEIDRINNEPKAAAQADLKALIFSEPVTNFILDLEKSHISIGTTTIATKLIDCFSRCFEEVDTEYLSKLAKEGDNRNLWIALATAADKVNQTQPKQPEHIAEIKEPVASL